MISVGGRELRQWPLTVAAALCVLVAWMAVIQTPAADASFGRNGRELFRLGGNGSAPKQALPYPGGRTLISLELFGPDEPAIVRLRPNGLLDRSFGNDGRAAIGSALAEIADIAVQPNGRILAVGARGGGSHKVTEAVAIRLLPNGRLDRSFARKGVKVVNLVGTFQQATAVAAMPNGSILLGGADGYVSRDGAPNPSFIVRLREDGRTDTGFAVGGRLQLPTSAAASDLDPTAGGSALVSVGLADPVLRKLEPDGSFDPAFGEGGSVEIDRGGTTEPFFTPIGDIAQAADGSILIAGSTFYVDSSQKLHFGMAAIRYSADGIRDPSYGVRGVARAPFDGDAFAAALAVQPNGRALIAGHAGSKFAAACFDPRGRRDPRFGRAGQATLRIAGSDRVEAAVFQAGGRVVLVGLSQNQKREGPYNLTALARLRIGQPVR